MPIAIMVLSTALAALWFALLCMAAEDDWIAAAYDKVFKNRSLIKKLRAKDSSNREKLSRYEGAASIAMHLLLRGGSEKKIARIEKSTHDIQNGKLKKISPLPMPGYVLQRKINALGKGGAHKDIMMKCYELHGKKHAENLSKHLLAALVSYPIIGLSAAFSLGALVLSFQSAAVGLAVVGISVVLILVLIYAIYDELSDKVHKRRAAIRRQFPNVVSKLALLVTAGMIMDRAWKETAYSNDSELYLEMRKTADELENLVSPESAYSGFIARCNTKETAKLASAVLQNLSKGNEEIGRALKDMAREAWLERRHLAKRDAEKANSKLMIPTMMLFLAVLVMLMVPIAMNFSNL